jgi:signal peptidase
MYKITHDNTKPRFTKTKPQPPIRKTPRKRLPQVAAHTIGIILLTAVLVFGAFVAYCLYGPDFDVAIVRGPSMEPVIKLGSLAFIDNNPRNVKVGDIVVFDIGEASQVIHRISSIDDSVIKTKGDNLEEEDFWEISRGDITAKYLFSVPYLGYISTFLGTKLGIILCVLVPGSLICLYLVYSIIKEVRVQKELSDTILLKYIE